MKSNDEIEALKLNWKRDPCWDLEDTDGFEDHRAELKAYQENCILQWKEIAEKRHAELASKICPLSFGWINWNQDERGEVYTYCKVEKCAWWNDNLEVCGIIVQGRLAGIQAAREEARG